MTTHYRDPAVKSFGYAAVHRFLMRVKVNWLRLRIQLILKKKVSIPEDEQFWSIVAEIRELIIRKRWLRKRWKIDLNNPHTLAEKIEWLKLNYHVPLYIQLSDKLAVRDYVRERLGSQAESVLNHIHGVYHSVKDIDFDNLPDKFVVKTNHGSGGNVICHEKGTFDRSRLDRLEQSLRRKFGVHKVEWPYWHIKPKILVEEYLEDQFNQLVDYKVFCFN